MGASSEAAAKISYEVFEPTFDWLRDEGSDLLIVNLPGFKKEHLKVQLDDLGNIKVSGNRPINNDKRCLFEKEFTIPKNCNSKEIRARFDNGTLFIHMPKTRDSIPPNRQQTRSETEEPPQNLKTGNDGKSNGSGTQHTEKEDTEQHLTENKTQIDQNQDTSETRGNDENQRKEEEAEDNHEEDKEKKNENKKIWNLMKSRRFTTKLIISSVVIVAIGAYVYHRLWSEGVDDEALNETN